MSQALTVAPVTFGEMEKMAAAVSQSKLFGDKTPTQALVLLLLSQAEGMHPMLAARDYDVIKNRPTKKSEAMMRTFMESGGKVKWIKLDDTMAKATFSHPQGGEVTIDWDMDRAKKAGLLDKEGSMYKKYPRRMLSARCISEGVKTVCPAATGGMLTPEEAMDVESEEITDVPTIEKVQGKASRMKDLVNKSEAQEAEVTPTKEEKVGPGTQASEAGAEPADNKETQPVGEMEEGVIEELRVPKEGSRGGCRIGENWYGTADLDIFKEMAEAADKGLKIRVLFTKRKGKGDKVINDALNILVLESKNDSDKSPI